MKTLDGCKNMFGEMSPKMKKEIRKYIADPNFEQWDEIAHYTINPAGKMFTVWNAVLEVDPSFPRTGRVADCDDNMIKEWERIPEPFLVLQAIRFVTGKVFS